MVALKKPYRHQTGGNFIKLLKAQNRFKGILFFLVCVPRCRVFLNGRNNTMWTTFKFWFASQITVKSWGHQVNGACTDVGAMIWMPNLYSTIKSISWGTFWVACTPEAKLKCKCHPCQSYSLRIFLNDAGLPKRRSFSSLLASLLSRRSCFSISALIRLDSFASSLRQQAIMESKVITAWAEKPVWQGEPGYTSHKMSKD